MKEEIEEENLHEQTENMLKKIQEQLRLSEKALNFHIKPKQKLEEVEIPEVSKSVIIPKIKKSHQNIIKIKDSSFEFVNLEENFGKKPENAEFDDCCSICSSKIYFYKYICVVCKGCILCPKCEEEHDHPVIKCKFSQLSTLEDIYLYMNSRNPEMTNSQNNNFSFLNNIFFNKYELKLECNSNNFSMRPNSRKCIPITIQNLSSNELNCLQNKIILFGRNNKDLKIYTVKLDYILNKNEQVDTLITIESNDICKIYDFTVEIFSLVLDKLKSNILNFKVEINNDKEDEELNNFFKDYPKIAIEQKSIKQGIKKILDDTNNKYNPIIVMKYLKNCNGNVDDAFYNLGLQVNNNIII